MDTDLEIEGEKSSGISRETSIALIVIALIVSCAVHIGVMLACADCAFAPLPGDVNRNRKWTKERPIMQVRKVEVDPYREAKTEIARPVAAPDNEKQEARMDRLSQATQSAVAPEMPAAAAEMPIGNAAPSPAEVQPSDWQPREQIAMIESPVVPDDLAAIPRVIVPKVDRVRGAADITPAYDLMTMPQPTVIAAPPPMSGSVADIPMPEMSTAPNFADALAVVGRPSASQELSDADRRRAEDKAAKAAERLNAEKKPVPPAPTTTMVDEKVVQDAKEAVRALRDDTAEFGKPFHENVSVRLGTWIDPANPKEKYFRVSISSRGEKPLPVVSKDMVFLLDASGSIGNDRLKSCRKAVASAIRLLNTGDRFNIIAFRDKFTFAFPEVAWRDVTQESIEAADEWLGKLAAHGQTDVFRTLRGVMTMPRNPTRPVVALVVTDGDATSGMTRSAEIVSKFGELNGGLISIFMYGVKENANAYLMDMLTRCNRGSWARHEGMRWRAADGIPALSRKFQRPVLSDISILFASSSRVEAYPQLLPSLCEDAPVEIYGKCSADQKDVVFSMRALNGATVFENMFRLPLGNAEKLNSSLRDAWAKHRLYALIAAWTSNPDDKTMNEIRSFASRYKLEIPYEREIKK